MQEFDFIVWDGSNTDSVVDFCANWDITLSRYFSICTNLINGKKMLSIEPLDLMRHYGIKIDIGQKCVCKKHNDGYTKYIVVEN